MVIQVYSPSEIAEILRVGEEDVRLMIESGSLRAFPVLGQPRVRAEALMELMERPFLQAETAATATKGEATVRAQDAHLEHFASGANPNSSQKRRRNRNPKLEQALRELVWAEVRKVARDFRVQGRTSFTASNLQGILCVSTTKSRPRDTYWLGFHYSSSGADSRTYLVTALPSSVFVIPYEDHRGVLDSLSRDRQGGRKFEIEEERGEYFLTGSCVRRGDFERVPLKAYLNGYHVFG